MHQHEPDPTTSETASVHIGDTKLPNRETVIANLKDMLAYKVVDHVMNPSKLVEHDMEVLKAAIKLLEHK